MNRLTTAKPRSKRAVLAAMLAAAALTACQSPEQKVERYYESGMEYLDKGDHGRANVQFQNVLKINDQHVPTLMGIARIAEERKEFEAMFGVLQKVVRLDPMNVEALSKLGQLYLIAGDDTKAMELAEQALQANSGYTDALTLKAAVLLRIGDEAQALEIAKAVQKKDATNSAAATIVATERAKNDDRKGALKELDRVLNIDPENAALQLLRIRLLAQQGRVEDVVARFIELTEMFPEEPAYRRSLSAVYLGQGDYDSALEQLNALVDMRPDDRDAKLEVVRVVRAKDGVEAAEEKFNAFIEARPEDLDLQFSLVDFYVQADKPEKARALLEKIASENPEDPAGLRAKARLAAFSLRDGDRAEAEDLVDGILAFDESNTDALLLKAQMQIADAKLDDAIANLRTALANDPESFQAMLLMSGAMEKQGNRDLARAELAKGFEASKANPRVANLFAKFLTAENNRSRAADVLEQSLERYPNDVENLKLLASTRLQLQDWRGAEEVATILEGLENQKDSATSIRAIALSGLKDYDKVIDLLSKDEDPKLLGASPLAMLVNAYLGEERFNDAIDTLKGVIDAEPENYEARILLANVYLRMDSWDDAKAAYLDAIKANSKRPEAYVQLYQRYVERGERDDAEAIIERGVRNAPESGALKVYLADLMLSKGDGKGALALYEQVIPQFGANKLVVNNYVSLTNQLRDDKESIQRALSYVDVIAGERNPYFQDTVGWAYYRAGEVDRALTYLSDAVEGAAGNAEIQYHFGAASLAAGDEEAGREALNKALELGGEDFAYRKEARRLLGD